MNKEFLRKLPIFEGLSEHDLEWLFEQAQPVTVEAGEMLLEEGAPGDSAYIVVDGAFEIVKKSDQQDIVIAVRDEGAVIGEMALIDNAPRMASVRAVTESHLLKISDEVFHQLLSSSTTAVLSVLRTVSTRLRQNEAMLRQSEKMAALGTLSAGLAHELNNPAAAARRAAEQLRTTLVEWQQLNSELDQLDLEAPQRQKLISLRDGLADSGANGQPLDPLALGDREGEIQTWLEDSGVAEAWELAPTLAAAGWDKDRLGVLCAAYSPRELQVVVRWLAAGFTVYSLIADVQMSSERISEIVKSVKTYSYLDQAPIQQVDIHAGIENTLVILRHKARDGIKINRQYAPDLPLVEGYGSELNQVWTNILDNAIDALQGQGEIAIRTYLRDSHVYVEIRDNGPGIPEDIQQRIFEPFFTTKAPGEGTGLGMHISYTIIHKHFGQISVTSQPGETCFQVKLPVQLPRGKG
jgi:signal transduction histidine kinase